MPVSPPKWDEKRLGNDRALAVVIFRDQRMSEPLDTYLEFYEAAYATFSDVMEASNDLRDCRGTADELLLDKDRLDVTRYIASPALSIDDLRVIADTAVSAKALRADPEALSRVMETILLGLDRRRFPWVSEDREPTEAEKEAAMVSTAALIATRRTETFRRGSGRSMEDTVKYCLSELGFVEVPAIEIHNVTQGPQIGQFCGETLVVGAKADVVVRLHDGRLMPIECKVSNSEVNSYKRLIHDCGKKAQTWVSELGPANCIPVAMLSGVYSLSNLGKAQDMGLTLFWAHDFEPMATFIESTT